MQTPEPDKEPRKKSRVPLVATLIGIVVVALGVWLLLGDDDSGEEATTEIQIVSVDELRGEVAGPGTPVYWAGEQAGTEIELSEPEEGRTYVRYLTGGAEAGDPRPAFLTVGTYESKDPVAALESQGKQASGVLGKAPGGATVYFDRDEPGSVYLAYPGVEAQIEVFDPDFERALQLVNSGQIVPVG